MRHQIPLKYFDEVARAGSIRKASEKLAIDSSALNRRILALEEELGAQLFERIPTGVRLSAAGELLVRHARQHMADMDQLRSAISDLTGERRGHVSIGCGEALMPLFMPQQIHTHRQDHPGVTFSIANCERIESAERLRDYSCELVLTYEPEIATDITVLHSVAQPIHILVHTSHPLASKKSIRLSDCVDYPLALPPHRNAIRGIIEREAAKRAISFSIAVEADSFSALQTYVTTEQAIAFQIPVGFSGTFCTSLMKQNLHDPGTTDLHILPVDTRDLPVGKFALIQLKNRILPIAAAKFAESLIRCMEETGTPEIPVEGTSNLEKSL